MKYLFRNSYFRMYPSSKTLLAIFLFIVYSAQLFGMAADCYIDTNDEFIGYKFKAYLAEDELSETGWLLLFCGSGFTTEGEYQPHFIDLMIKGSWADQFSDGLCAAGFPSPDATHDNFTVEFGVSDYEDSSFNDNDIAAWSQDPLLFPRRFSNIDSYDPSSPDKIMAEYQVSTGGFLEGREIEISFVRAEAETLPANNFFMDPDNECIPNAQADIVYRHWIANFKVLSLEVDTYVDFYINESQASKLSPLNAIDILWENPGRPAIESDKYKVIIYDIQLKNQAGDWEPAKRFFIDYRSPLSEMPIVSNTLVGGYRKVTYKGFPAIEASFGYGYTDYVRDGDLTNYEQSNGTKGVIYLGDAIYVDQDAPGPVHDGTGWDRAFIYLQDALAMASQNTSIKYIYVAEGTYKPDQTSGSPDGSKDRSKTFSLINHVTLMGGYAGYGQPYPNLRNIQRYETILSGDLNGDDSIYYDENNNLLSDSHRADNAYHVVNGSFTVSTAGIDGFTIKGGTANSSDFRKNAGGGIEIFNGNPTITHCRFVENAAVYGGAIINHYGGSPRIDTCQFENNQATEWAAILTMHENTGTTIIENCTFYKNRPFTSYTGAVQVSFTQNAEVHHCHFERNTGCALNYSHVFGTFPIIADCTFIDNDSSGYWGSALSFLNGGNPVITRCIFMRNHSGYGGAAIQINGWMEEYTMSSQINNCIFSENSSDGNGGAIYNLSYSDLILTNCTSYLNQALNNGGFICNGSNYNSQTTSFVMKNCILWNDRAGNQGNEIFNNEDVILLPGIRCCDIQGCLDSNDEWDQLLGMNLGGNLNADPLFVDPDRDDFHLKSRAGHFNTTLKGSLWITDEITSPCIDRGDPEMAVGDEPLGNGNRINMGAFGGTNQASKTSNILGDVNGDGTVNLIDLTILAQHWLES